MSVEFPPGLILIVGAFLLPLFRGKGRELLVLGLPILTLFAVWTVPEGAWAGFQLLGYELDPVRPTPEGRVFATAFSVAAFGGGLFALRHARLLELVAAFAYAGSAVGVTFAGDLITLFVFWEIMALGSTLVLWASDQPGAYAASMRYLVIHVLGGVILMFGIAAYVAQTGSVGFGPIQAEGLARWCILVGFLINAGAPPLSAWIPDAYPEASPTGMVFLSVFTTKTAVFALLVAFPGSEILIPIGLYMAIYGVIYALRENDLRRILAYCLVNQVGFMVTAVGIGTPVALNGAAAHAFAHIVYESLLVMAAGSVLLVTGKRKCTELGGLARALPFTAGAAIVGGLAISSVPYTAGFISKSLSLEAAIEEHMALPWFVLMAASAGVFLAAGLRFPRIVFFRRPSELRPPPVPGTMKAAIGLFALGSVGLGVAPGLLYSILPFSVHYEPYTAAHLSSQLQLLLFAALAFVLLARWLKPRDTITLDWDWCYREGGRRTFRAAVEGLARFGAGFEAGARRRIGRAADRLFETHGPHGILARTWPTGSMVLWVMVLLGAFLLFYYV